MFCIILSTVFSLLEIKSLSENLNVPNPQKLIELKTPRHLKADYVIMDTKKILYGIYDHVFMNYQCKGEPALI